MVDEDIKRVKLSEPEIFVVFQVEKDGSEGLGVVDSFHVELVVLWRGVEDGLHQFDF